MRRGIMALLFLLASLSCSAKTDSSSLHKKQKTTQVEELSCIVAYADKELIKKAKEKRKNYLKKHKSFPEL